MSHPDHPTGINHPTVRPRDAATLVVLKPYGSGHRVLMGRRHHGHKFMPGKYVFPGGRLDYADWRVKPASELAPDVVAKLLTKMRGPANPLRARALALAALRETFEETGLAVGAPGTSRSRSPGWKDFLGTGVVPALGDLRLIARAITPPGRVRRFDTRFFAVNLERDEDIRFLGEPSAELEEVSWLEFGEARELDLPQITRRVIGMVESRLAAASGLNTPATTPFYYHRASKWIEERL